MSRLIGEEEAKIVDMHNVIVLGLGQGRAFGRSITSQGYSTRFQFGHPKIYLTVQYTFDGGAMHKIGY